MKLILRLQLRLKLLLPGWSSSASNLLTSLLILLETLLILLETLLILLPRKIDLSPI